MNILINFEDFLIKAFSYTVAMQIKNLTIIIAGIVIGVTLALLLLTKLWLQSNIFWIEENLELKEFVNENILLIKLTRGQHRRTFIKKPHSACEAIDMSIALFKAKRMSKGTLYMVDVAKAKRRTIIFAALVVLIAIYGIISSFSIHTLS